MAVRQSARAGFWLLELDASELQEVQMLTATVSGGGGLIRSDCQAATDVRERFASLLAVHDGHSRTDAARTASGSVQSDGPI